MLPGLLVLLGSALVGHLNNEAAQKRVEALRRSMEAYQRTKAAEGEAATEQLIAKQTHEQRGTELAQVTADRTQSLKDTVGAAQASQAAPIAGKLSSDYRATEERNATTVAERTRRAIQQLATMGAPSEQQQKFQLRFGKAAGDVDAANIASGNVGRSYLTGMNNVRPDPMTGLLSQVGMTFGSAMMAPGAGGGSSVNNGQGYEDASGNLYSDNVTRQQRLNRGFSLWGRR